MFKKAWTGFMVVAAATGSLAAIAPAHATQTIQETQAIANSAQTELEKIKAAEDAVNEAKEDLQTATNKVTDAENKLKDEIQAEKKAQDAKKKKNNKANRDAAEKAVANLKSAEQVLETAKSNLESVTKAIASAQQALETAKEAEKTATVNSKLDAWGNWTNTHTVQDKSQDKTDFQALIPQFKKLIQNEGKEIPADQIAAKRLDPTQLFLLNDHNVRVWFLDEGAGYRNQLAYEALSDSGYEKGMIFNDISCTFGCQRGEDKNGVLDIGDFVDIGSIKAGTQLNFLLKADGANANPANGDIYGGNVSLNPDAIQHLMAWQVGDYLMLGFEDLRNGGDKDYNDTIFVMDFGKGNLTNKRRKVPEPGTISALLGVTGAGMWLRCRRSQVKISA